MEFAINIIGGLNNKLSSSYANGKIEYIFSESFEVTIDGTTYNNVELSYIKLTRVDGRYFMLGSVISGSQLGGALLLYNSFRNKWTKIVQ